MPVFGKLLLERCARAFAAAAPSGAVSREAAQTDRNRRRDGRTQPVTTSQRQTNGCHHGNDGRNCGRRPHATQHCTGNVTRWK